MSHPNSHERFRNDHEFFLAVRRAIGGGAATSGQVVHRLRKLGVKFNAHDVIKILRRPLFELTSGGWRNALRQTTIFDNE